MLRARRRFARRYSPRHPRSSKVCRPRSGSIAWASATTRVSTTGSYNDRLLGRLPGLECGVVGHLADGMLRGVVGRTIAGVAETQLDVVERLLEPTEGIARQEGVHRRPLG